MSTDDHRIRDDTDRRGARRPALAGYAAAGPRRRPGRRCARPLGVEDRTAGGRGYALTFDDGPHAQGHAGGARAPRARAGAAPRSSSSASRSAATPPCRGRSPRPDTRSPCTATATATCCASRPGRSARTSLAPRTRSTTRTGPRPAALPARPTACSTRAALRLARARGWRTLLWSHWGRDWEARATPSRSPRASPRGAGEGSVLLLHDADDYSAPGSWRRTVAALPRGDRDAARARARAGPSLTPHGPGRSETSGISRG